MAEIKIKLTADGSNLQRGLADGSSGLQKLGDSAATATKKISAAAAAAAQLRATMAAGTGSHSLSGTGDAVARAWGAAADKIIAAKNAMAQAADIRRRSQSTERQISQLEAAAANRGLGSQIGQAAMMIPGVGAISTLAKSGPLMLGGAAAGGVAAIIRSAISEYDASQTRRNTVAAITGDYTDAIRLDNASHAIAQRYGVTSGDAMSSMAYLARAGFSSREAEANYRAVLTATQGDTAKMQPILEALTKAKSSGLVREDVFEGLDRMGIGVRQDLQSQLGVSATEFASLLSKGAVGIDMVTESLQRLTAEGTPAARAMDAAAQSIDRRMTAFADGWGMLMDTIGGGLQELQGIAGAIMDKLNFAGLLKSDSGGTEFDGMAIKTRDDEISAEAASVRTRADLIRQERNAAATAQLAAYRSAQTSALTPRDTAGQLAALRQQATAAGISLTGPPAESEIAVQQLGRLTDWINQLNQLTDNLVLRGINPDKYTSSTLDSRLQESGMADSDIQTILSTLSEMQRRAGVGRDATISDTRLGLVTQQSRLQDDLVASGAITQATQATNLRRQYAQLVEQQQKEHAAETERQNKAAAAAAARQQQIADFQARERENLAISTAQATGDTDTAQRLIDKRALTAEIARLVAGGFDQATAEQIATQKQAIDIAARQTANQNTDDPQHPNNIRIDSALSAVGLGAARIIQQPTQQVNYAQKQLTTLDDIKKIAQQQYDYFKSSTTTTTSTSTAVYA